MVTLLGYYSLYAGFFFSVLWILLAAVGVFNKDERFVEAGVRAQHATFALVIFASLALVYALLSRDFSIDYVARYSSSRLSVFYTLTAFWAGMEGSLLFWTLILSIFLFLMLRENRKYKDNVSQWISLYGGMVFLFFITMTTFLSNPLTKNPFTPADGRGLNPLLQNISMAIHPVTLYLGYVGFAVPFVYAMAALTTGNLGVDWLRRAKKWTLLSWIFLTLGIFLGGRWAYVELGWGGYWAWDPVENASFIPWLTGTALLHSMILQETRGILKRWNFILVILTFALTIMGTFITRSGIVSSVHAFGSSNMSIYFVMYMLGWGILGFGLVFKRWKALGSEKLGSFASKEGFFVINNWLFVGLAFAILFGVFLPVFSELFRGVKITVGPPFFNTISVPLFFLIFLALAICPFLTWRSFSSRALRRGLTVPLLAAFIVTGILVLIGIRHKFALIAYSLSTFVMIGVVYDIIKSGYIHAKITGTNIFTSTYTLIRKNSQKYGGYVVHFGVAMVAIGITASSTFKIKKEVSLTEGQAVEVGDFQVLFQGKESGHNEEMEYVSAKLALSRKSGKPLGILRPELRHYWDWPEQNVEVDLKPLPEGDFYATFMGWDDDGKAVFDFYFNPLIQWIWVGSIIMIIGGIISYLPYRRKESSLSREKRAIEKAEEKV